jgi:hypothetical protein
MPYNFFMRRRSRILLSILCGIGLLLAIARPAPEPTYGGHSLSVWLKGFEGQTPEIRWQSAEALRHIGTNALPFLISRLGCRGPVREPQWKRTLRGLLEKQSLIRFTFPRPADQRAEALAALDALGPVAEAGVPAIEALLHENPPDPRAPLVLARLGPSAVPALNRGLTNNAKIVRLACRTSLDLLRSHSELLFPKTSQDAEFMRRTCEFNLRILNASSEDFRLQHPEQFSPDRMPKPSLPPDFLPPPQAPATNRAARPLPQY